MGEPNDRRTGREALRPRARSEGIPAVSDAWPTVSFGDPQPPEPASDTLPVGTDTTDYAVSQDTAEISAISGARLDAVNVSA